MVAQPALAFTFILSVLLLSPSPKAAPHLISYSLNLNNLASSQEMLNFGLVPSDSGPRTMDLLILNSGTRPVTLTSLVATPVTDALAVEFASVKVILVIDTNVINSSVIDINVIDINVTSVLLPVSSPLIACF